MDVEVTIQGNPYKTITATSLPEAMEIIRADIQDGKVEGFDPELPSEIVARKI